MAKSTDDLEEQLKKELWIGNQAILEELNQLSKQLVEEAKETHVIALGQSPAWVVTAVKIIANKFSCQHVAMSGGVMTNYTGKIFKNTYFEPSVLHPLELKQKEGFKQYLKSIHITPEIIMERYRAGQKTIVFDFISSGSGLASFLYILNNWAEEEGIDIQPALGFIGASFCYKKIESSRFYLEADTYTITGCILPVTQSLFKALGGSIDEGELSDRLVPSYPHCHWEHEPQKIDFNKKSIQLIYSLLKKTICEFNNIYFEKEEHSDFQKTITAETLNVYKNIFSMFNLEHSAQYISTPSPAPFSCP